MTKQVVAAAFDSAAKLYGQPIFVVSVGVAIRTFENECKRAEEGNVMRAHPEHFTLFQLGTYDNEHGTFQAVGATPMPLASATDYVQLE